MDAEPGGILYLQEFFSDSVNEITFSFTYEQVFAIWTIMLMKEIIN